MYLGGFGTTLLIASPHKELMDWAYRDGWFLSGPVFHKKKEKVDSEIQSVVLLSTIYLFRSNWFSFINLLPILLQTRIQYRWYEYIAC